jgi:hypothetical protein
MVNGFFTVFYNLGDCFLTRSQNRFPSPVSLNALIISDIPVFLRDCIGAQTGRSRLGRPAP